MAQTTPLESQHALLEAAKKYADNPAVQSVVLSITEAQLHAQQHLAWLEAMTGPLKLAAQTTPGYHAGYDHSALTLAAAKGASALEALARLFATLAGILNNLGEDVRY